MKTIIRYVFILLYLHKTTASGFTLTSIFGTSDDPDLPETCYGNDINESLKSGVNDVVIVRQSDGTLKSTALQARVGKLSNWKTLFKSRKGKTAKLYINNIRASSGTRLVLSDSGAVFIHRRQSKHSCLFSDEEIQTMGLNEGINNAVLVVNELDIEMPFSVYLFNQNSNLVITDIDGTITTSDVKGFLVGNIGVNVHHSKVVELFDKVSKNGYIIVYLTARPIAFDGATRKYLFETLQGVNEGLPEFATYSMPLGPLFLSPISAEAAITADAEIMKVATLRSLLDLFDLKQDIVAGAYGNKNTDTEAYLTSGIMGEKIYLINEASKIINVATGNETSYRLQTQRVNEIYPKS